jgi:hypothetical protein
MMQFTSHVLKCVPDVIADGIFSRYAMSRERYSMYDAVYDR